MKHRHLCEAETEDNRLSEAFRPGDRKWAGHRHMALPRALDELESPERPGRYRPQPHRVVASQIGGAARASEFFEIQRRCHRDPIEHGDAPGDEVAVRQIAEAKHAVDSLLDDVDPAFSLAHCDRDLRVVGQEPWDRRHQEVTGEGALHFNPQLALGEGAVERPFRIFDVIEDREATPIISFAIERRANGPGRALQEKHAEPILQLLDHLSRGGARNVEIARGLSEAAAIDHPGKQPHCVEPVHARLLFFKFEQYCRNYADYPSSDSVHLTPVMTGASRGKGRALTNGAET